MARTALPTATRLSPNGVLPGDVDTAAEIADGNSFPWSDHRFLYVLNGDDADLTVTIPTPGTIGRGANTISDTTVTVAAGTSKLIGGLGTEHIQTDGTVHVNYAGTTPTGVMVAVFDA